MSQLFYLQDSRSFVGNDVLWWCEAGKGYTTDLSKAAVYSEADAQTMHLSRSTDIPWPKPYIDAKTRPAVDMQYIRREEALKGTAIVLAKEPRKQREPHKCHGCGRFMTRDDFWYGACIHCGTDNRP